jgi:hypothetical protein
MDWIALGTFGFGRQFIYCNDADEKEGGADRLF